MKCLVLIGFAGPVYSSAPGKEINLPLSEARSLAHSGIVKILEDYTPPTAYETVAEAKRATRVIIPKRR